MDGDETKTVMCVLISSVAITILFGTLITKYHETQQVFLREGYNQVALPGVTGVAWQKEDKGDVGQIVQAINQLNNRVTTLEGKNVESRQSRGSKDAIGTSNRVDGDSKNKTVESSKK